MLQRFRPAGNFDFVRLGVSFSGGWKVHVKHAQVPPRNI